MIIYCYSITLTTLAKHYNYEPRVVANPVSIHFVYLFFLRQQNAVYSMFTFIKLLMTNTNDVFTTVNTPCKEMNKIKIEVT